MKSVVNKKAFTIIELLVAMALLVMMLGLSAMVFNTSVETQRAASATIDISRNLRALTGQLNADFKGLRKEAPLFLWFDFIANGTGTADDRSFDAIHFFADGDFQAIKQYQDSVGGFQTIYGNLARIYYGHARANSDPAMIKFQEGLLARKCHILTSLLMLTPIPNLGTPPAYANFVGATSNFNWINYYENSCEYNSISLNDWINVLNYDAANAAHFIKMVMFDATLPDGNMSRPLIEIAKTGASATVDQSNWWNLFAQGVLQMRIQWAYTPDDLNGVVTGFTDGVRWWPSEDADGDPTTTADSDFGNTAMNISQFGVYFQLPNAGPFLDMDPSGPKDCYAPQTCKTVGGITFKNTFYPKALKFTFTLRDSNGFFKDGKTFTHIVYLEN